MCRAHNNANVLCLGERVVGRGLGRAIAEVFVRTPFEGGRHERRLKKISDAEQENLTATNVLSNQ
jgi:ribose 5-phosphate isomerase B